MANEPESPDERRRKRRYLVGLPARIIFGEETVIGRLQDVCRDAAFVEAERWFPLESEVALSMDLPGVDEAVRAHGTVIRLAPGALGRHGMAVLFKGLSDVDETRIERFISQQD
jgi:hypothetical protein